MLKWYTQPEKKYNGERYRERLVVLDEKMIPVIQSVPEAIVVSSWRSLAEQKELVKKGASKTLQSNHRRGMAVDIVNWKELDKELEKAGLVNDISWDQNHYTLEGESKTTKYPLIDTFKKSEDNEYKDMKLEKKLKEAIKEVFGEDYGESLNENEQEELAKDIKALSERGRALTQASLDETLKYKNENESLKKELEQAKALVEMNAKDATIISSLKFLIQTFKTW